MTSIVIIAGDAGSRALVGSADSAARQATSIEIVLAVSADRRPSGAIASLVKRLQAVEVRAPGCCAAANDAVIRARGDAVVLLAAPWRLERGMVERSVAVLDDDRDVQIVVPALRLHTVDGFPLRVIAPQPTLSSILSSPLATPPVIVIRRGLWDRLGGLDPRAGDFAWCEWFLRAFAAGTRMAGCDDALASLPATDRNWWPPKASRPIDLASYRAVLEKHRSLLDASMSVVLVRHEIEFGHLLERHREEQRNRDRLLAELERVRAEAAHHHAYLAHHGRQAVEWGDLRRADPVSREWGYDRGVPVDRRYIEDFLAAHSSDISGSVLEVQEDDFTQRFGGPRVVRGEVIDLDDSNPRATLIADLRSAVDIAGAQFDCIILTQTLHVIDDMPAALAECHRILKPGGVLLATLPAASRVCLEYGEDGDLWRLTPAGARALVERSFGPANVETTPYGSVLTNVAFLHGLACDELTDEEFEATDPYHPVLVGVRATKELGRKIHPVGSTRRALVLLYHRVDDQPDVHDLAIPAALLEQQLEWLATQCRVLPLEQLLTDAQDGLPDCAVAITFDDGYLDTLEVAAPLIERLGLSATVFATSRWLDGPGEYWWDALERALLGVRRPADGGQTGVRPGSDLQRTRPLSVEVGEDRVRLATATPEQRRAAHDRLHAALVHATREERDRAMSQIGRWSNLAPDRRRRPMMAEELQRLSRVPGISIGAHGVDHLALPDQPSGAQHSEIVDSMRALERVLSRPVDTFAFPYGAIDRGSADLARQHCRWSMACDRRALGSSFDAARVPRLEVKRWDVATLRDTVERAFGRIDS
jgi:peptidoglycan/xylan/chitin deacetylase (PgdA/CDA1 family)